MAPADLVCVECGEYANECTYCRSTFHDNGDIICVYGHDFIDHEHFCSQLCLDNHLNLFPVFTYAQEECL